MSHTRDETTSPNCVEYRIMRKVECRPLSRRGLWVLMLAVLCAAGPGCRTAERFRAAAGSSLHTGVQSIATGLIDGMFAVFEPEPGAN